VVVMASDQDLKGEDQFSDVNEQFQELANDWRSKREVWPDRYEVIARVFPLSNDLEKIGCVTWYLFREDMSESEHKALLEPLGFVGDESEPDYGYICSQADDTFSLDEALQLRDWLEDHEDAHVSIQVAYKPRLNAMGFHAYPVGGAQDFLVFPNCDDYDLPFEAWAYVDHRDDYEVGEPSKEKLEEHKKKMIKWISEEAEDLHISQVKQVSEMIREMALDNNKPF